MLGGAGAGCAIEHQRIALARLPFRLDADFALPGLRDPGTANAEPQHHILARRADPRGLVVVQRQRARDVAAIRGTQNTWPYAPGMTITRAYAKLPAQDPARAKQFYAEHFGLEPHREMDGHLSYDVSGTELVIFPSTGAPSGDHDQFGLVVEDLETEVARLKEAGVEFPRFDVPGVGEDGITDRGHIKAAWFRDSEGNLISIAEFART